MTDRKWTGGEVADLHRFLDDCTRERDEARAEVERLRDALTEIRDHGTEPGAPCHAIGPEDCVDVMREVARAALVATKQEARTSTTTRREDDE